MQTLTSSLIGRERELSILTSRAAGASKGKGGLVFLKGEAGIGKTRLLSELRVHCDKAGMMFLQGRSYGPTIPYSPWTEAINDCVRSADPQTLKTVCRGPAVEVTALVPSLASLIGTEQKDMGLREWVAGPRPSFHEMPVSALASTFRDEAGRISFFEGVTQFFINISKKRPLVMSLEDLHRADKASLILLRYLVRHIFSNRVFLIGSFREEELDTAHPLSQLVMELEKEALSESLRLDPLPREAILQIVSNTVGDIALSQQVAESVYGTSRGNPFLTTELIRSLAERGIIGPRYVNQSGLRRIQLPSSVKALMKQRFEGLDPECVELLTTGSVIGQEFDHELLASISHMTEDKVLGHLETALRKGLLQEKRTEPTYRFEFTDPRIRTVLQEDLSAIRRMRLHDKIGQAIEKNYSEGSAERLAEAAHHFVEAGNVEKATEYSMLAGNKAASMHAYDEAIRHYLNVVEFAENSEQAKVAEARIAALRKSIDSWNSTLGRAAEALTVDRYGRIADHYEASFVPLFEPLAKRVIENANLREGQRVLDVGTGTGLAAFLAAEAVGARGKVLGIDVSDGMLSVALKKSKSFPHRNVEFIRMDETSLDLPEKSFDTVISNLGLTRFNPDRAFMEMHRVLKPNGRLVFNEWAGRESAPEALFYETLTKYRTRNPSELVVGLREARTSLLRFYERVTDKDILQNMLRQAGFKEVSATSIQHHAIMPLEGFLKMSTSGALTTSVEIAEMSEEARKEFEAEVRQKLESLTSPAGVVLDWNLNYYSAKK